MRLLVILCLCATHYGPIVMGQASWFHPKQGDNAHVCAMNVWKPGHHIRIVNDENGNEAACVIVGTGPFVKGRVLDVSPIVAKELGFYSAGVARVRVYEEIK